MPLSAIEWSGSTTCRRPARRSSHTCQVECWAMPRPATAASRTTSPKLLSSRPCRSEEHTSELQSLMRISYAVFCLKKKKKKEYQQNKHIIKLPKPNHRSYKINYTNTRDISIRWTK